MHATLSIDVDVEHDLIVIEMGGFFGPDDISGFVGARNKAHRKLSCGPNQHVTLVDIRNMSIQAQESVSNFAAVLANPRYASKRLAFVVSRSLARLQVKRAAEGREARYFTCPEEAASWLTSEG